MLNPFLAAGGAFGSLKVDLTVQEECGTKNDRLLEN